MGATQRHAVGLSAAALLRSSAPASLRVLRVAWCVLEFKRAPMISSIWWDSALVLQSRVSHLCIRSIRLLICSFLESFCLNSIPGHGATA